MTSSIPVEGSEEADKGPRTTYSVDPSRLNFDVRTPSGVGYFRAFVDGIHFHFASGTKPAAQRQRLR